MTEAGEKLTLKDIASMAGTSVSTVSRVLSDHPKISAETKKHVLGLVRRVGFELNPSARALAGGKTGMVGVLSSSNGKGFFAEVIRGIDSITRGKHRHLLCSFSSDSEDYYAMLTTLAKKGQVDGLILVAPPVEIFSRPYRFDIPLVCCASAPPETSRWRYCDSITFDNPTAMHEIIDHLAESGCRTLVHAAGPDENFDAVERLGAFLVAAGSCPGLSIKVERISYNAESIRSVAEKILLGKDPLPDAIVAWNDSTAVGFMEVLKRLPPGKAASVRVTGWDNGPMDDVIGLTSVRMPMREMGARAAFLLNQRLDHPPRTQPVHEEFTLELVIRVSSSQPSS